MNGMTRFIWHDSLHLLLYESIIITRAQYVSAKCTAAQAQTAVVFMADGVGCSDGLGTGSGGANGARQRRRGGGRRRARCNIASGASMAGKRAGPNGLYLAGTAGSRTGGQYRIRLAFRAGCLARR